MYIKEDKEEIKSLLNESEKFKRLEYSCKEIFFKIESGFTKSKPGSPDETKKLCHVTIEIIQSNQKTKSLMISPFPGDSKAENYWIAEYILKYF